MIKLTQEIKDLMVQVGETLDAARGHKLKGFKAKRAKRTHKLVAGRLGKFDSHSYSSDYQCQERTAWIHEVLKSALTLDVSRSVMVRRAIQLYQEHLILLITSHTKDGDKALMQYLGNLEAEREALFAVANRDEKLN